jgi:glycosyltransferase involved in cell wall biosynthesis
MTVQDESSAPLVTVGLPVFNGERYLRGALDSLLAQELTDFELVVSDNGSTDGSRAICAAYAARDPRIRFVANDVNRGAAWNFNHVVHQARGRFFMWAAHDDLWHPECLARYVAALQARPDAALVCGRAVPIGRAGDALGAPYAGFANVGDTALERLRRLLSHWASYVAIYGMFRTDVLRRTRLILPKIACEMIILAEVAVQGKTLELPGSYSYLRTTEPGERYRTADEQLSYLDPGGDPRAVHFAILAVTLETMKFVLTTGLVRSPVERCAMLYECARAYLARRLAYDVKAEVVRQLEPDHGALLRTLRAAYRAARPRQAAA